MQMKIDVVSKSQCIFKHPPNADIPSHAFFSLHSRCRFPPPMTIYRCIMTGLRTVMFVQFAKLYISFTVIYLTLASVLILQRPQRM